MKPLLILCLSIWCLSLPAATYYVDYVSGSDANAGTSIGAPFQHCPGDPRLGTHAPTLTADDFVALKGGVVYSWDQTYTSYQTNYITITNSGTVGHPITIISGERLGSPYGAGPAVIDISYGTPVYPGQAGVVGENQRSNIVFNGLVVCNLTNTLAAAQVNGAMCLVSQFDNNNTIENCIISNCECHGIFLGGQGGVSGANPINKNIISNNISWCGEHGIYSHGSVDNLTISGNHIDYCGVFTNAFGFTWTGGTGQAVGYGNPIAVFFSTTDVSSNLVITGNFCGNSATKAGCIIETHVTGYLVASNTFIGQNLVGALNINNSCTNGVVCCNLFSNANPSAGACLYCVLDASTACIDGLAIYNNTFVGSNNVGMLYFQPNLSTLSTAVYRLTASNNIVWAVNNQPYLWNIGHNYSSTGPLVDLATFGSDYNVFYGGQTPSPMVWNGVTLSFAAWQSTTGQDAHSVFAAPSLDSNYMPLAGAPEIGAGVPITGITTDLNGFVRNPLSWDIGAINGRYFPTHYFLGTGKLLSKGITH